MEIKTFIFLGTRPEAIKLASVIKKLPEVSEIKVIVTGQHKELLDDALNLFKINYNYRYDCHSLDLVENFFCIAKNAKEILKKDRPHAIIVQGDTLTTFAVSFAAFMEKIPIIHLEAGLRSGNKFSPFPEEIYRILTDDISDIYLAPTKRAYQNLLLEGKKEDRIFLIGNTVVDAIKIALKIMNEKEEYQSLSKRLNISFEDLINRPKVLITSHRRENIGKPLEEICQAIRELSSRYKDILFIWSLHKNPLVREIVLKEIVLFNQDNLILVEPLTYLQTLLLIKDSLIILTDSGGIQEEAPTFNKRVLILRETTERVETVEYGYGKLIGTKRNSIIDQFENSLREIDTMENTPEKLNPYGDGKAIERLINLYKCDKFIHFLIKYPETIKQELYDCKRFVRQFHVDMPNS
ncbi:MAG: UDP-N-acetylglucosamine 2-epimerase (non-hydrolyzing) [Thermodesulfovibrionales bacterium]|nr:UDP-N-acetylglucosamine 2-epimerase (non-hydrolyzing) [Thermodesulfovibrionales bacterium]